MFCVSSEIPVIFSLQDSMKWVILWWTYNSLVILCYPSAAVSTGESMLPFEEERKIVQLMKPELRNSNF